MKDSLERTDFPDCPESREKLASLDSLVCLATLDKMDCPEYQESEEIRVPPATRAPLEIVDLMACRE